MSFSSFSPRMKRGSSRGGGPGRGRTKQINSGFQQTQPLEGLYSDEKLVNAVTSVLGCPATVTGKNGKQFEGVFKTISPEASVVLGKANRVDEQRQNGVVVGASQKTDIFEQFVIHQKDWARIEFEDVNLEECIYKKDGFKTDMAISGGNRLNGQKREMETKELKRWEPGEESLETSGLEGHHSMENGWSAEKMFEKNERMGVKSTYNEDMEEYTTKLDKVDTPEYRERERIAALKAEEIAKESPYERGTLDSGRTEEQSYSAVVRSKQYDRSSAPNWRQHSNDRPPEQRSAPKLSHESYASSLSAKKEQVRSQQMDEPVAAVQVKEKIEKPTVEMPVECKPEEKVEIKSEVVSAEPKPEQNEVNKTKSPVTTVSTPAAPQIIQISTETPQDPGSTSETTKRDEHIADLKNFSKNFQLADGKKKTKGKKTVEEEEKTVDETTKKQEKNEEEVKPPQEVKNDPPDSEEKKTKSELNPNAQEFRPRGKRNTPSPARSNSTASSSGAPSPFQNNSPHPPYTNPGVYQRNGPRGRGIRQEYLDPTTGFVNASNAVGQPFFAHVPPSFMHQPSPGMNYMPSAGIRHPAVQHQVFLQQHPHQGHVMLPLGQMPHGPYPDNTIYYGPPVPAMIQSPPHLTSPSIQQSQFNFPSPGLPQTVNPVRPVTQSPAAVIPPQPSPAMVFMQRNNEIQPTQILNRPPPTQSFPGN